MVPPAAAPGAEQPAPSQPGTGPPFPGHHERLWVPVSWCLVAAACVASVAVICFFYTPGWVAVTASVLATAVAVGVLVAQSAPLVVDEVGLRAGRSRIEWTWVAGARALTETETEARTRGRSDVGAFRVTRPYLSRQVRVELADPADPHPAWLVGSRRPEELAAAINVRLAGPGGGLDP